MSRFIVALALLTSLSGCATAKPIIGPDGSENQLITCERIEKCYEKAREACGGNYKLVNTTSNSSNGNTWSGTEFSLLVKCEK